MSHRYSSLTKTFAAVLFAAVLMVMVMGCGDSPDVEIPANPTPAPGPPQAVDNINPDSESLMNSPPSMASDGEE